jgi:hypothetical protein
MPKFSFTDQRLDTRQWTDGGRDCHSHALELRGRDEKTGTPNQAILIFDGDEHLSEARAAGTVGYVTHNARGGISLVGWLPLEAFGAYQEVISCGNGLSVSFKLRDPRSGSGYVCRLGISHHEKVVAATICRRPASTDRPGKIIPLCA